MSKNTSISTVYMDPPQFTTNPCKLDIRVDDVALYGAKDVRPTKKSKRKPIRLADVVEDLAVIKKFTKLEGEVETKIIAEESEVKKELDLEAYSPIKTDDEDPAGLMSDTIVPTRLIVGFDTEYVTKDPIPSNRFKTLTKAEKDALKGSEEFRNEVLSYQYYAILPAYDGTIIKEWSGILYVEPGQRLSRSQFISAVYMHAFEPKKPHEKNYTKIKRLPKSVVLVGHYTKVDLPAFSDFKDFKHTLDSVRKSMITVIHDPTFAACPLINGKTNSQKKVFFLLRDTFLLTSSVEQSLASLGKLLDLPKLAVSPDDYKKMDNFLQRDRKSYEAYAIRDAEIAAKYALSIYANQGAMGLRRDVPPTLSGMGVGLLLNYWMKNYLEPKGVRNPEVPRMILGQKVLRDTAYVKPSKKNPVGYTRSKQVIVDEDLKHWNTDFTVDCYHGGRNEQYFFGAGETGHWFDYDLRSAYPTAMSLIPRPNWQKVYEVQDLDYWKRCDPDDLSFFFVNFDFTKNPVRFPVLPIRTQYGLIYPLKGQSCCTAAEIVAARNLGAEITQLRCVKAESDKSDRPFKEFILYCIENRNKYPLKSLRRLIWKEMTNGTYGKLAQGLRIKRAYNLREDSSQTLRPSKLTNSFYASFVTGFVRAALGEIMNALPQSVSFSNCTTDGILCTAPIAQIKNYLKGPIGKLFHENALLFHGEQKLELTGFLEVKSEIKQPLGWKTRGQATLQFLKSSEKVLKDSSDIVLAKAGISTPPEFRNQDSEQNQWIINTFKTRNILTKYDVSFQASTRRIAQQDWDAISFYQEKYLNMEFDWKRCPINIQTRSVLGQDHLYFDTKPWNTLNDFYDHREAWIHYFTKCRESATEGNELGVLKTQELLKVFLDYVPQRKASIDAYGRTNKGKRKYSYTRDPHRGLKIEICTAFGKGLLGFPKPEDRTIDYPGFAAILNKHLGTKTLRITRYDIDNNIRRKEMKLGCIPKTPELVRIVGLIKKDSGIDFDDSLLWAP